VLFFGLTGAPHTFQRAMNSTLAPLLRKSVLVFFDDILVYSQSYADHLEHLEQVLRILQQNQWRVKLSKCSFAQRTISYLRYVISEQGVATCPDKIQAVAEWSQPQSVKELRSFLGLAGYYRKFVKQFGIIAWPLTKLLRKGTVFQWTQEREVSFQTLKKALVEAPVLALPDFSQPFCIETDASDMGVGVVLMHGKHPIAFISKTLGPKLKGLSTYEKEYIAILLVVEQWKSYLRYSEFHIYTDQRSLVHLNKQRLNTIWQQEVFTKLLGLNYRIIYKKGVENAAADAMSRRPAPLGTCLVLSSCQPLWLDQLVSSYQHDKFAKDAIAKLTVDASAVPHFSWSQGLLRYKDRIWVGSSPELQAKLITSFHDSALGGHSGIPVTYKKRKQFFAWKGMKGVVHDYVQACMICQQAKTERIKSPGLLQPLPIPSWQIITMNFIEGLPQSGSANCIFMMVDKFTKFGHFIALKHPYTAASVAKVFMDQVYKLDGLPASIVSDRNPIFTSNLWRELFSLAHVTLKMSTTYHPQFDDQTERVKQCLETFLRCFISAYPKSWWQFLALAQFWYNTSFHTAIVEHHLKLCLVDPPDTLDYLFLLVLCQWG
jgi:hypothetical protein